MYTDADFAGWQQAMFEGLQEQGFDNHNCTIYRTSMGTSRTFLKALNQYMEYLSMTKNTKKPTTQGKFSSGMPIIVNVQLDASDEPALKKLANDPEQVYGQLTAMITAGYKVTFSVTSDGSGVMCSVTCRSEGDPNNGKLLSGFSADWYYALVSFIGKHAKVKGVWPDADQQPKNRPLFG